MMAAEEDTSGVRSGVLLRSRSSWDGTPYHAYPEGVPELNVLKITVPARGELQWHAHPTPSAAYVLSGEITVEAQGNGKQQHFSAGQVIPETVDAWHRGVVGDAPAVFIVFYAGAADVPLSIRKQ